MSDQQQVRDAGINSAVIVDDGYDEIPTVEELRDEGAWENFFYDAQGDAAEPIAALFPHYSPENREELKVNQEFINALWRGRANIGDLLGDLFDDYERKVRENRPFLEAAEAALLDLDIPFEKLGRDFEEAAARADLIVIDLFLGIQQRAPDRQYTVEKLKELVASRPARELPSIILMSQLPNIDELAREFRKDVNLHASAFRQIGKNELLKPGRMEGMILTLAMHRSDSQALATFLQTWETKAKTAVNAAAGSLRKIDIDDLHHIRSMLLRFEGLNTSSYMLDVFDRVLQFEIESHSEVIKAALSLDKLSDEPAPLMISIDRDSYSVLEQTMFVNPHRLKHATGAVWPFAFGDIVGPTPNNPVKRRGFFSGRDDLVFFVASPACDLIRKDGLTTALLVAGSLKKIDMTKPGLAISAKTTPVITMNGGRRFQVDWDFGDLRSINLARAKRLMTQDLSIIARLREGFALGLRQQFLSNVGRVGEPAPFPRSHRFRAKLHLPLQDGTAKPIDVPDDVDIKGNVLIPRKGSYAAAILDSDCENHLTEVLIGLDLTNVARNSRAKLETLKEQTRFRQMFRSGFQGIELPLSKPRGTGLLKLGIEQPDSDAKKPKIDTLATILEGEDIVGKLGGKLREAGLIVQIHLDD